MLEKDILKGCKDYLTMRGIFHWRSNNMGTHRGDGKYSFSGMRGVSDILAILEQKCPCGTQGVLLAIETKVKGKKPSKEQQIFLDEVNRRGGLGICVHSVYELDTILKEYL